MKKIMIAAALLTANVEAHAAPKSIATEVTNAAYLHARFTDVFVAVDRCPKLTVDIKRWDQEMPTSAMIIVKAFNATEQGAAWYGKRDADFEADPAKECADAEKWYGAEGMGLLKRK